VFFVSTRSRPETDDSMRHTRTRTAALLASAALLVSASPALAAPRHDAQPPTQRAPRTLGETHGTLAVMPPRTRLVTMPG
jgi:hypothetical protein